MQGACCRSVASRCRSFKITTLDISPAVMEGHPCVSARLVCSSSEVSACVIVSPDSSGAISSRLLWSILPSPLLVSCGATPRIPSCSATPCFANSSGAISSRLLWSILPVCSGVSFHRLYSCRVAPRLASPRAAPRLASPCVPVAPRLTSPRVCLM